MDELVRFPIDFEYPLRMLQRLRSLPTAEAGVYCWRRALITEPAYAPEVLWEVRQVLRKQVEGMELDHCDLPANITVSSIATPEELRLFLYGEHLRPSEQERYQWDEYKHLLHIIEKVVSGHDLVQGVIRGCPRVCVRMAETGSETVLRLAHAPSQVDYRLNSQLYPTLMELIVKENMNKSTECEDGSIDG